jgi:hypothetical protein
VGQIQDAAQVVDGLWALTADGVRTTTPGYDRLVAIGDVVWDDYEVEVPFTVHSIFGGNPPGVGILMRWNGHTDDPIPNLQPKTGFYPLGAIGWYRWRTDALGPRLQIYGNGGRIVDDGQPWTLKLGTRYMLKMRVETKAGLGGYYRLKVWEASQPEPANWDASGQEGLEDPQKGSFCLLAHRADVTFGDVTVTPLSVTHALTVGKEGSGTVTPTEGSYIYGQGDQITLRATPDPGWVFDSWGGANGGEVVPTGDGVGRLTMNGDKQVTALFVSNEHTLTVATAGNGQVQKYPDQPIYYHGDPVTLTALPGAGWGFAGWSGDLSGSENPVTISITASKVITATFTRNLYPLTVLPPSGQGSMDPDTGTYSYFHGDEVLLTTNPAPGWSLTAWLGANGGEVVPKGENSWALLMDGPKEVQAVFTRDQYWVNLTYRGQGRVVETPGGPYLYGEVTVLEPRPASYWIFVGWGGPDAGDLEQTSESTWSIVMDGDKDVTAIFRPTRLFLPFVRRGE